MLMETLRADQLAARKEKNTVVASLLTTLIGEAAMIGKNDGNRETNDAEVVAVVKKFIKNIDETIAATASAAHQTGLMQEKAILEGYLPQQLSESELTGAIAAIVANLDEVSPRKMGEVMKELKAAYDGRYDGKAASTITKDMLA